MDKLFLQCHLMLIIYQEREEAAVPYTHEDKHTTHKEAAVSTKTLEKHYMDQGPTIIN